MIQKLFGKWASIVSAAIMLGIAVLQHVKPEILSGDVATNLMLIFGIHAGASDTVVSAVKAK